MVLPRLLSHILTHNNVTHKSKSFIIKFCLAVGPTPPKLHIYPSKGITAYFPTWETNTQQNEQVILDEICPNSCLPLLNHYPSQLLWL